MLEVVPVVGRRKAFGHENGSLALSAPAYCMNHFFCRLQPMILPRVVPLNIRSVGSIICGYFHASIHCCLQLRM